MEKEFALLTDIIKGEVCGAPISLSPLSPDEAKALFVLSKRHELAHIAGNAVCRDGILPEGKAKQAFQKEAFAALYRYEMMERELSSISALLENAQIPFIPLKGSVLRAHYPAPWMRNSCDIDILVKEESLAKAKDLLLSEKYTVYGEGSHDIAFDSPRGVHIELHFRLLEDRILPAAATILKDPWKHALPVEESSYRYALSDAAFYFYHIAHMAKHYLIGGCGIRPFLDLWVMTHRMPFDPAARTALLEEGNLLTFHSAVIALTEVWFGEAEKSDLSETMEQFILKGGVYGTVENRVSLQQAKRGGKLRYALARIFLPYELLKFQYPVLHKHKWLLPLCEIRRFFRLLFLGGARRSAHELQLNSAVDTETISTAKAHLKELGF